MHLVLHNLPNSSPLEDLNGHSLGVDIIAYLHQLHLIIIQLVPKNASLPSSKEPLFSLPNPLFPHLFFHNSSIISKVMVFTFPLVWNWLVWRVGSGNIVRLRIKIEIWLGKWFRFGIGSRLGLNFGLALWLGFGLVYYYG